METILQAIGNVGFPIVVTAYLLVRIENKLEGLADSITSLANIIDKKENPCHSDDYS
ncbi:MAG TPA: YvrJ family protein [Desulfotomaculum sp.]|nr:YvrJ family protein [Desulfotomaculum sp.]